MSSRDTIRAGYSRISRFRSCCRVFTTSVSLDYDSLESIFTPKYLALIAIRAGVTRTTCTHGVHPRR